MRLGRHQQTFRLQVVEQLLPRDVAIQSLVFSRAKIIHFGVEREHADGHQLVALADLPVVEVVCGGDLDHAGAKFAIDIIVGNDGDAALGNRQPHLLADQVGVTLVFRMHRHRGVAEQGFGAGGGDGHKAGAVFQRVVDFPDEAVFFGADDFEVGYRGAQYRIPVHQPFAAINQAFAIQAHEDFGDGFGQPGVHGEAFAAPVGAGAEPAHLVGDGGTGLILPLPDLVEEFFAPQFVTRNALGVELAFHHDLGGDARVVGAGLPQRVVARHAVVAGERVHQRVLEGVAHVQRAGDVRRR